MSEQQESSGIVLKLKGNRMFFPALFKKDKYDRHSANFALAPGKLALPLVIEVLSDEAKRAKGMAGIEKAIAEGSDYARVVKAILDVSKAKWGTKDTNGVPRYLAMLKSLIAKDDICLRNGDNKPDVAGYPGNYILSAVNQNRPTMLDRYKADILTEKADSLLYSGSHPIAVVEIWAQDNPGKGWRRVNCQLQGVQEYKPGEKIGGGRVAKKDEFDDLGDPDETQADDLTGGYADEDTLF